MTFSIGKAVFSVFHPARELHVIPYLEAQIITSVWVAFSLHIQAVVDNLATLCTRGYNLIEVDKIAVGNTAKTRRAHAKESARQYIAYVRHAQQINRSKIAQ